MEKMFKPYLISITQSDVYGNTTGKYWAVDFELRVGELNLLEKYERLNLFKKIYSKIISARHSDIELGNVGLPVYAIACSNEYLKNPNINVHSDRDLKKAFVQESFDSQLVEDLIVDKFNSVHAKSWDDLLSKLDVFLDVTNWSED